MKPLSIKKAKPPRRQMCKDFLRLARADDLLSRAGAVLMKTSPKATAWTAGIAVSGRLATVLGLPGFTRWQALTAPVIVGGGLLGLGAALRYIPRMLSGRLTTVAEANDLNLMEDYRKTQARDHLSILWDKVFWYESALRYSAEQRAAERAQMQALRTHVANAIAGWDADIRTQLGLKSDADRDDMIAAVLSERPLSDNLEKSREGFLISALYALRHALPQSSEADNIGFRLNLYEDFCDGAYFDASDTKLAEQYAGNVTLMQIKRQIGFGRLDSFRQVPRQITSRLWFFLITRKVALGAGRAVRALNEQYDTDLFNSQVLLWPGEEEAQWLTRFEGARDEVLRWRRCIITAALGTEHPRAVTILDRAFLPACEFAAELRARFDPEYVEGLLDYTSEDTGNDVTNSLIGDLQALGYRDTNLAKVRGYVEKVKHDQATFDDYLAAHHPDIAGNGLVRRAVKIAFHIDASGLKKIFQSPASSHGEIDRLTQQAAEEEPTYTARLIALRLHHQLTLIQRHSYQSLAHALAYSDTP